MIRKRKYWHPRIGQKRSRLTFVGFAGLDRNCSRLGKFNCECGVRGFITRLARVRSGVTKSCGCWLRENSTRWGRINIRKMHARGLNKNPCRPGRFRGRRPTHGHSRGSGQKTFHCWQMMLQRCFNPNHHKYKYYGGRGVVVCDRWNPARGGSFQNFLDDMQEKPEGLTLGRVLDSPVPGYCKENCCWQSAREQWSERKARIAMKLFSAYYGHRAVKVGPAHRERPMCAPKKVSAIRKSRAA
jgi:hypothetical protein